MSDEFAALANLREGDLITASHITLLHRLLAQLDRARALAGIDPNTAATVQRIYDQEAEEVY